jgi:hypothetical protein
MPASVVSLTILIYVEVLKLFCAATTTAVTLSIILVVQDIPSFHNLTSEGFLLFLSIASESLVCLRYLVSTSKLDRRRVSCTTTISLFIDILFSLTALLLSVKDEKIFSSITCGNKSDTNYVHHHLCKLRVSGLSEVLRSSYSNSEHRPWTYTFSPF